MSEPVLVSIYKDVYGVMSLTPQKTSFFHHIRRSPEKYRWLGAVRPSHPSLRKAHTNTSPSWNLPILDTQDWTQQQEPLRSTMLHTHQGKEPQFMTVLWLLRKLLNVRSITTVSRERPVQFLPLKSTSKPKPPVKSLLWITDLHQPSFAKT